MNQFSYENQGAETLAVYKLKEGEHLDSFAKGMLQGNDITGVIKPSFMQRDTELYLKYPVTSKLPLMDYFQGEIEKKALVQVLLSIVKAVKEAEEYMLAQEKFLLETEHIFVDISRNQAHLIYLPVDEYSQERGVKEFLRNLLSHVSYKHDGELTYVARLLNGLNRDKTPDLKEALRVFQEISEEETDSGLHPLLKPQPNRPVEGIDGWRAGQSGGADSSEMAAGQNPGLLTGGSPGPNYGMVFGQVPGINHGMHTGQVPGQNAGTYAGQVPGQNAGTYTGQVPGQNAGTYAGQVPGQNAGTYAGQEPGLVSAMPAGQIPGQASGWIPLQIPGQRPAPGKFSSAFPDAHGADPEVHTIDKAAQSQDKKKKGLFSKKEKKPKDMKLPKTPGQEIKMDIPAPGMEIPAPRPAGGPEVILNVDSETGRFIPGDPPLPESREKKRGLFSGKKKKPKTPSPSPGIPPALGEQAPLPGGSDYQMGGADSSAASGTFAQSQPQIYHQAKEGATVYVGRGSSDDSNKTVIIGGGGDSNSTVLLGGSAPASGQSLQKGRLTRRRNGQSMVVNKEVFHLGKESSFADFYIGDNPAIGAVHADIFIDEGQYYISDRNSVNHTYVNREMVLAGDRRLLKSGDVITLANEDFDFIIS